MLLASTLGASALAIGLIERTATARVVLDNTDGRWRPGLFVTGQVQTQALEGEVVIPKAALQSLEDRTVVCARSRFGLSNGNSRRCPASPRF